VWSWAVVLVGVTPWTWFVVRDLSPLLDALALAIPLASALVSVALGLSFALGRRPLAAVAMASWLAFALVATVGPWVPTGGPPPPSGIRVVEANVLADASGGWVTENILWQRPDVVVVSELGPMVDERLAAALPYVARSPESDSGPAGDVGVFSRWPVSSTPLQGALARERGMRVVISAPSGEFVIYALHLDKPAFRASRSYEVGFRTHRVLIDAARADARAERLPTLVIGDLNLVDRTSGYRAMRQDLDDAMRANWVGPTSVRLSTLGVLGRVDHVFMPRSWCSDRSKIFRLPGSDHLGLAVTLGPC
jgi:endonuclease/exonuclease/phosphatase (EEP) superfamily protein YafD